MAGVESAFIEHNQGRGATEVAYIDNSHIYAFFTVANKILSWTEETPVDVWYTHTPPTYVMKN